MTNTTHAFQSNLNRKKAKTTFIIFTALTAVFAGLAGIFGSALPSFKSYSGIDGKDIEGMTEYDDGSSYLVYSYEEFNLKDTKTEDVIQSCNYVEEISEKVASDGNELVSGSLLQFNLCYKAGTETKNLLVFDNKCNIFKYEEIDGTLVLQNDYYVSPGAGAMLMVQQYGDDLFVVQNFESFITLQQFDLTDLSRGLINSKLLWDYTKVSNDATKISPLQIGLKYQDLSIDENFVYICAGKQLIRVDKSFKDFELGSYLELAKEKYFNISTSYMIEKYKAVSEEVKEQYGFDDETIESWTYEQLLDKYYKVTGLKASDMKKDCKNLLISENNWITDFDVSSYEVTIDNNYYQKSFYSTIKTSIKSNAERMIYVPSKRIFIVASSYDDHLYELQASKIADVGILDSKTLDDFVDRIEISFGSKKFYEANCIQYNRFADTLFVIFASSDVLAIIDLNDEELGYSLMYNFSASYDIKILVGTSDNSKVHYYTLNNVVNIKGETTTYKTIYYVNPQKTSHASFYKLALILSAIFGGCSLVAAIISIIMWKKKDGGRKLKILVKDIKKNKWVYVALIPFVAALILFCYYEAVGSISLSFFDYTRNNPSMKWNNFGNYLKIFNQPDFLLSIGNMFFFLAFDLFISLVPPLIYAFFLSIMKSKKYSKFLRSVLLIPGIIPGIASLLIWRTGIFGEYGVLNTIIKFFNGEYVEFLANSSISRWSLILMGFPFIGGYLVIYGGMMNIPNDFHEEAELSGVGVWKRFFTIDLPLVMPQLKYIFIMTFISSVQNYSRTYMLQSSGTVTPVEKMYVAMTNNQADYGLASAYATLIFIFLFFAVAINFKNQKKTYLGDN